MPVPCFSDTDCIQLAFDAIDGLTATPILDPEGGLVCTPGVGLGIEVPHARAYRSAAATHTDSNGFQAIAFDVQSWDNDGIFTPTSANFTINTPGLYSVMGMATFAKEAGDTNPDSVRYNSLYVNGAVECVNRPNLQLVTDFDDAAATGVPIGMLWRFDAGDVLQMRPFQNSGGNLPYQEGSSLLHLAVAWMSR